MATNMFKNIYEVEDEINQMMSKTAISFGQLDSNGYGPMTASTYGQAEMQGRAIGGMLGGIDPRMKEAELQAELMKRHPDPRTRADLLAVAKDAGSIGLPDIQAQMLSIAAEMPDIKKASKGDIGFLTNHMGITNSSTQMLDAYIKQLNPQVKGVTDEDYMTAVKGFRTDTKKEFDTILTSYGIFLQTNKNLTPSDIQEMAFTPAGQKKNALLFKGFLSSFKEANPVAKYLDENNTILIAGFDGGDGNEKDGPPIVVDKDIKITGNETLVTLEHEKGSNELPFHEESKVNQKLIKARSNNKLINNLEQVYMTLMKGHGKLDALGSVGELFMNKNDLDAANRRDGIKDWMGGEAGFSIHVSPAMKHFQSNGPEAFLEFQADPMKYYREVILQSEYYSVGADQILGTDDDTLIDSEREIPMLWGIN